MRPRRPRLTPAMADVRRAVRDALAHIPTTHRPDPFAGEVSGSGLVCGHLGGPGGSSPANGSGTGGGSGALVLVALSGGPDSLALALATAFEAPRLGYRVGAVVVDHGLQSGSADVAARAARQAEQLGLAPVVVRRVRVGSDGGPEAAARAARYEAFAAAAGELGASAVLTGHTLDDQAETVLLGLARGSGTRSLAGMAASTPLAALISVPAAPPSTLASAELPTTAAPVVRHERMWATHGGAGDEASGASQQARGGSQCSVLVLRPLLGVPRATTVQACADAGLEPWADPHNSDAAFTRVRVRSVVMPTLERELGPGIAAALSRSATQLRDDADALDHFAREQIEDLAEHADSGIALPVAALAANPPALRHRLIRLAVSAEFGIALSRAHTLEVSRLVDDWRGQGALHLPRVRVERRGGRLLFTAAPAEPEREGQPQHDVQPESEPGPGAQPKHHERQ